MPGRRRLLAGCLAIMALALFVRCTTGLRAVGDPEDLRAFYCAGETVQEHHDPYLAEPLRSCENREIRAAGSVPYRDLALPAPLPAFAFVPFEALSLLAFGQATSLFTLLLLLAMACTALLVCRMTGAPFVAAIAALLLSDCLVAVLNGQILPFALLALTAAGFALSRERYAPAAVACAAAAIEPHVALPAIVSLALLVPRCRLPLAASLGALALTALAVAGLPENLEYLGRVLPAHALSEAAAGGQYSLTSVLIDQGGLDRVLAVRVAEIEYALACAAGVGLARLLAARYASRELIVLLPPAIALFGGPFVHLTQMAVAIPALFVLAYRVPSGRTLFGIALLSLAIPWQDSVENGPLGTIVPIALVSYVVARALWPQRRILVLGVTLVVVGIGAGESAMRAAFPPHRADPTVALRAVREPDRLAEASWQAYVDVTGGGDAARYLLVRLPTWAGLGLLIVGCVLASRREARAGAIAASMRPTA